MRMHIIMPSHASTRTYDRSADTSTSPPISELIAPIRLAALQLECMARKQELGQRLLAHDHAMRRAGSRAVGNDAFRFPSFGKPTVNYRAALHDHRQWGTCPIRHSKHDATILRQAHRTYNRMPAAVRRAFALRLLSALTSGARARFLIT